MGDKSRAVPTPYIMTSTFTTKVSQFSRYILLIFTPVLLFIPVTAAYFLTAGESSTETVGALRRHQRPGPHAPHPRSRGSCPRRSCYYGLALSRSRLPLHPQQRRRGRRPNGSDFRHLCTKGFGRDGQVTAEYRARERARGHVYVIFGAGGWTGVRGV